VYAIPAIKDWFTYKINNEGIHHQSNTCRNRMMKDLFTLIPKALFAFTGGCGSMYEVLLESEEFKGHRTVAQHRMVNEVSVFDWSIHCRITFNINTELSCFRLKPVFLNFSNMSL